MLWLVLGSAIVLAGWVTGIWWHGRPGRLHPDVIPGACILAVVVLAVSTLWLIA